MSYVKFAGLEKDEVPLAVLEQNTKKGLARDLRGVKFHNFEFNDDYVNISPNVFCDSSLRFARPAEMLMAPVCNWAALGSFAGLASAAAAALIEGTEIVF